MGGSPHECLPLYKEAPFASSTPASPHKSSRRSKGRSFWASSRALPPSFTPLPCTHLQRPASDLQSRDLLVLSPSLCDEQLVSMARFLLACLVAAHIIATTVVVAAGRPLHDAAAPATAELVHAEGGAAPLSSVGVSLHGSAVKIAAGPAAVLRHPRHKSFDKSIAGAEVILGGLATAVIAAVFCYIRVTRRRSQEGTQENKS